LAHPELIDEAHTHRLIPAKYGGQNVFASLSLPPGVVADLNELEAATNERKNAEAGSNLGIGPGELLYGVPEAHIVNAAFAHAGPYGGRFHSPGRGAWYAGVELETSVAEVAFHKRRFLQESRISGSYTFDYVDFQADFCGSFHHLDVSDRDECLRPAPVPQCYAASQKLAHALLYAGSNGILYASVRQPSGTCVACFRPALVFHPRRHQEYRITLEAATKTVSCEINSRNSGNPPG
jgi:RES domain-containing protein